VPAAALTVALPFFRADAVRSSVSRAVAAALGFVLAGDERGRDLPAEQHRGDQPDRVPTSSREPGAGAPGVARVGTEPGVVTNPTKSRPTPTPARNRCHEVIQP
jgi:hypothetical protein